MTTDVETNVSGLKYQIHYYQIQKYYETTMIISTNTIINPWTVMIIHTDTSFTKLTMFTSIGFQYFTITTDLIVLILL